MLSNDCPDIFVKIEKINHVLTFQIFDLVKILIQPGQDLNWNHNNFILTLLTPKQKLKWKEEASMSGINWLLFF